MWKPDVCVYIIERRKYVKEGNNLAKLEKLIQSIMSGTQDRNIKFVDLQKILDILGFQCRVKGDHFIKNVEIVISEWIETAKEIGREIPKAKGKLMFA